MDASTHTVSPLRQRMIEDMCMRRMQDRTQQAYIRGVRRRRWFPGCAPDTATAEDLRRFQLHLVKAGVSPITLNATLTAVRFLFQVTLDRPAIVAKVRQVRVEQRLPVVLSRADVARLIKAAGSLKYQTALSLAYGAGLRAGEVVALKTTDVDSTRMTLRIEQAKGRKDRYAICRRSCWSGCARGGATRSPRDLWRRAAAVPRSGPRQPADPAAALPAPCTPPPGASAGIDQRVSMHTLRHCFATHLLEQKEDIRVIQVLLGHKKIDTTTVYTHVATQLLREVVSPIESARTP